MEKFFYEQEKEKRREQSLHTHERLHRLFKEDRLAFERERRDAIQNVLNSVQDEEMKKILTQLQALWDKRMRGAGSAHNRLVLAQTFFWDHFHNGWHARIQELNLTLNHNTTD